jgi:hypothetical protein
MRRRSFPFTLKQYGRNKGKSREANATLPQGAIPHSRRETSFSDSPPTFSGNRSTKGSDMRSTSGSTMLSSPPHKTSRSPGPPSTRASTDAMTHVSLSLTRSLIELFFSRIMLAQRLAELASANAEGLLEYVALASPFAYFELNHKLATTNIDCFARTCSNDLETRQSRRKPPLSPPPVQVDLAHLGVRVYSWLRFGSVPDTLS